MSGVIIFLLSFYFGVGSFFSFVVAPELFRSLEREVAGSVVEKVFPLYFGIGLGAVGISLLLALSSKMSRFLLLLLGLNLILLGILEFYVLPQIHELKLSGSPEFMKMHLISVIMSTVSLFLTFGSVVFVVVKTRDGDS